MYDRDSIGNPESRLVDLLLVRDKALLLSLSHAFLGQR